MILPDTKKINLEGLFLKGRVIRMLLSEIVKIFQDP